MKPMYSTAQTAAPIGFRKECDVPQGRPRQADRASAALYTLFVLELTTRKDADTVGRCGQSSAFGAGSASLSSAPR